VTADQTGGASELQTAVEIQKKIVLLLRDYRSKNKEMHERAVPIEVKRPSEQHK
jgi:hypothetical protein